MIGRPATPGQAEIIEQLEGEGYTVLKRGWPTICAVRGDVVRFIVINGPGAQVRLSPVQRKMAAALKRAGLEVEVVAARRGGRHRRRRRRRGGPTTPGAPARSTDPRSSSPSGGVEG